MDRRPPDSNPRYNAPVHSRFGERRSLSRRAASISSAIQQNSTNFSASMSSSMSSEREHDHVPIHSQIIFSADMDLRDKANTGSMSKEYSSENKVFQRVERRGLSLFSLRARGVACRPFLFLLAIGVLCVCTFSLLHKSHYSSSSFDLVRFNASQEYWSKVDLDSWSWSKKTDQGNTSENDKTGQGPPTFLPFTCSASCSTYSPIGFPIGGSELQQIELGNENHILDNAPPTCWKYMSPTSPNGTTYDPNLFQLARVSMGTGSEIRRILGRSVRASLRARRKHLVDSGSIGLPGDKFIDDSTDSFQILILGGSVSNCRGVSTQECWHSKVGQWFKQVLPLEADLGRYIGGKRVEVISQTMSEAANDLDSPRRRKRGVRLDNKNDNEGAASAHEHTPNVNSHQLHNLAKSATGSAFFAHCLDSEYKSRPKISSTPLSPDLVILEFGVNDVYPLDQTATKDFERLIWRLRTLESKPAIIILEAASLHLAQMEGILRNAEYLHLPVAHFHDIPLISAKSALFSPLASSRPSILSQNPDGITLEDLFIEDKHHFNVRGHELMADLLVGYLEGQLCQVQRNIGTRATERVTLEREKWKELEFSMSKTDPENELPPYPSNVVIPELDIASYATESLLPMPGRSLFMPFAGPQNTETEFQLYSPQCVQVGLEENFNLPIVNEGWSRYAWARDKQYLTADDPGSKLVFEIEVGQGGEVLVDWLRSRNYNMGNAKAYLDDNEEDSRVLVAYWDLDWTIGVPVVLFEQVPAGKHKLTIEVLPESESSHPKKKTHFRLIALVTT